MKVLHLDSEASWRGGEQQIAYLIESLNQKVNHYVAGKAGSELSQYCSNNSIPFFPLSFGATKIKASWQLASLCKKEAIDIVHMHSANAHTVGVYSTLLGNKSKLILSKRTDFAVKKNFLSQFKYNHSSIKRTLCVSHTIKDILLRTSKPAGPVDVIHSGINPAKFNIDKKCLKSKLKIPKDCFLIGNTSALADQKDYFTFLNVAKELVGLNPLFHFVIIGDGPMKKSIQDYCNKLGLEDRVHFTGFMYDLPKYLESLDLFLITSKTEGLGTSILDAMICKIPVVATNAGGITESVLDNKTGLTCPIADTQCLAQAVEKIFNNQALTNTLCENAYQNVLTNFHYQVTANKTFEAYEKVYKR